MKKVAVIFGGRSGEHEVSLASATYVIKEIDREKYEVIEVGITREGVWYSGENCLQKFKDQDYEGLKEIAFTTDVKKHSFDIAYPVLHGPFGEDGTIQGLFEMLQIPYTGCGVLASALAMDKVQSKTIWQAAGLQLAPYIYFFRSEWEKDSETLIREIENEIGLPCFVKPVNMGSSVGVTKAKNKEELIKAIELAAKFDSKIMVEKALRIKELECSVIGNEDSIVSPVGEVLVAGEFYDYNDKYVDGKSSTRIPADIPPEVSEELRANSLKAYKLLDCSGFARVDSFLDLDSGKIFINEINTIPGCTKISMFPMLLREAGMKDKEIIDKIIQLGFERFEDRQKNEVNFDSGSDWFRN